MHVVVVVVREKKGRSPVDEDVHVVLENAVDLRLHLLLLCHLHVSNLRHCVDTHARAKHLQTHVTRDCLVNQLVNSCEVKSSTHFDFIGVHGSVGNEDLGILDAFRLIHSNFLVEKKTFIKIRILQTSAKLFNQLNCL